MPPAHDESRLIRQIYAGALQRDPEERDEFLDRACVGKPELRRKVAALLEARSQDSLEAATIAGAGAHPDYRREDVEGRRIGPYIIRREIGRGGMGVVYLAEDTRLSRRVALKALRPGLGHEIGGRERLRLEPVPPRGSPTQALPPCTRSRRSATTSTSPASTCRANRFEPW